MPKFSIPKDIMEQVRAADFKVTDKGVMFTVRGGQISASKFLTRQLKLGEKYKDDEIRDFAQDIETEFTENRLVECTTVEDFIKLYSIGNSCMTFKGEGAEARVDQDEYCSAVGKALLRERGLWSTMFYYYSPDMRGFYLLKNNKMRARALVLHGRTSTTGGEYYNTIEKELRKLPPPPGMAYTGYLTTPFKVPGVEYKNKWYCPFPNIDGAGRRFVKYNPETHEFHINDPDKKGLQACNYTYKQWLESSLCPSIK